MSGTFARYVEDAWSVGWCSATSGSKRSYEATSSWVHDSAGERGRTPNGGRVPPLARGWHRPHLRISIGGSPEVAGIRGAESGDRRVAGPTAVYGCPRRGIPRPVRPALAGGQTSLRPKHLGNDGGVPAGPTPLLSIALSPEPRDPRTSTSGQDSAARAARAGTARAPRTTAMTTQRVHQYGIPAP